MLKILERFKGWLLSLGVFLLVLVGAYSAGARAARRAKEKQDLEDRLEAVKNVREFTEKVQDMDDRSLYDTFKRLRSSDR